MTKDNSQSRAAVANSIFGAVVAVLIIASAIGLGLYATAVGHNSTSTVTITTTSVNTEMVTTEAMVNQSTSMLAANSSSESSFMLTPKSGAMISSGWLLSVPIGMHEYAVSVHAEGLEPNGTYILEGALSSGSMQTVPISSQSMTMNTTAASEFQADRSGIANYWIVLDSNPVATFENTQLLFLPGMEMNNASVVATVNFAMMSTTETTMMSGST